MDDLRPRGSVEVKCSHPKCDLHWWLDPLDPRLPDGPFDCGGTHEDDRQDAIDALWPLFGLRWGSRSVRGPRSDGKPSQGACSYGGEPAGTVTFNDKWNVRYGSYDYEDIRALDDPFSIPERIDWECRSPHVKEDNPGSPDREPLPRMGGTVYIEQPDGSLKPMRLVLHKCTECGRTCFLYETHPKAYSGPATCADEAFYSASPCPVRNKMGHTFDKRLAELHGPGVEWTMWDGMVKGTKNPVRIFDRGAILVRKLVDPKRALFALIEYDHPNMLLVLMEHFHWVNLNKIVLPRGVSWEMSDRIEKAIPFVT